MEITLDRKLSDRRIFPSIDIIKSGSRRDDLLLNKNEQAAQNIIRKLIANQNASGQLDVIEKIISMINKTKTNVEFMELLSKQVKKTPKE